MKKKSSYSVVCHNEAIYDYLRDPANNSKDPYEDAAHAYGWIVKHGLWLIQNAAPKKVQETAFGLFLEWAKYIRDEANGSDDPERVIEQTDWMKRYIYGLCFEIRSRYTFEDYDEYIRNMGKTEFQMKTLGEIMHTELDKIPTAKRQCYLQLSEKAKRLWEYSEGERKSFL